jgi:hypothetical protein
MSFEGTVPCGGFCVKNQPLTGNAVRPNDSVERAMRFLERQTDVTVKPPAKAKAEPKRFGKAR